MPRGGFHFPMTNDPQFDEVRSGGSARGSDPEYLYYNSQIINNSTATTSQTNDPIIRFQDTRSVPILQDKSKYAISVSNFTINGAGKELPVMIPQIRQYNIDGSTNTNPNNTVYDLTFTAQYGGTKDDPTQVYQSTRAIQWEPENQAAWTTQPAPIGTYSYPQPEIDYYYCYTYSHWVKLVNKALALAWKDVLNAAKNGSISGNTLVVNSVNGTFVKGQIVTNAQSGSTGIVVSFSGDTLVMYNIVGAFNSGEVIFTNPAITGTVSSSNPYQTTLKIKNIVGTFVSGKLVFDQQTGGYGTFVSYSGNTLVLNDVSGTFNSGDFIYQGLTANAITTSTSKSVSIELSDVAFNRGTFLEGEQVYDQQNGSAGTVESWDDNTSILILSNIDGPFIIGDNIFTGQTGIASITTSFANENIISGIEFGTKCPFFTYDSTTNLFSLWQDSNTTVVPYGSAVESPSPLSLFGSSSALGYLSGEYSFIGYNTNFEALMTNFNSTYYSDQRVYPPSSSGSSQPGIFITSPTGTETTDQSVAVTLDSGTITSFTNNEMVITFTSVPISTVGTNWVFDYKLVSSSSVSSIRVGNVSTFRLNTPRPVYDFLTKAGIHLTGESLNGTILIGELQSYSSTTGLLLLKIISTSYSSGSNWIFRLSPITSQTLATPTQGVLLSLETNVDSTATPLVLGNVVTVTNPANKSFNATIQDYQKTIEYDNVSGSSVNNLLYTNPSGEPGQFNPIVSFQAQNGTFVKNDTMQGTSSGALASIIDVTSANIGTTNEIIISKQSGSFNIGDTIAGQSSQTAVIKSISGSNGPSTSSSGILTLYNTFVNTAQYSVTSLQVGTKYIIHSLGTTNNAQWGAAGVQATPAVGISFIAIASTVGTGTVTIYNDTTYCGPFAVGDTITTTDEASSAIITAITGENGYTTLSFSAQKNPFVIGHEIQCYPALPPSGDPISLGTVVDIISDNFGYANVNIANQCGKFGVGESIVDNNFADTSGGSVATIVAIQGENNGYGYISYINEQIDGAPSSFIGDDFLFFMNGTQKQVFAKVIVDNQSATNQTEGNIGIVTVIVGYSTGVVGESDFVFHPDSPGTRVILPPTPDHGGGIQIKGSISGTTADYGGIIFKDTCVLTVNNICGTFFVGDKVSDTVGFGLYTSQQYTQTTGICNGFSYLGHGQLILKNTAAGHELPATFPTNTFIVDVDSTGSYTATNPTVLQIGNIPADEQFYQGDKIQGTSDAAFSATEMANGTKYAILTDGSTDFTTLGAYSNAPGTVFTSTGPATSDGSIFNPYLTPIIVGSIVQGQQYIINTLGTTTNSEWNSAGASGTVTVGQIFTAIATGTVGTGTVTLVINVTSVQPNFDYIVQDLGNTPQSEWKNVGYYPANNGETMRDVVVGDVFNTGSAFVISGTGKVTQVKLAENASTGQLYAIISLGTFGDSYWTQIGYQGVPVVGGLFVYNGNSYAFDGLVSPVIQTSSLVVGTQYQIAIRSNINFTTIGASSNAEGTVFTATSQLVEPGTVGTLVNATVLLNNGPYPFDSVDQSRQLITVLLDQGSPNFPIDSFVQDITTGIFVTIPSTGFPTGPLKIGDIVTQGSKTTTITQVEPVFPAFPKKIQVLDTNGKFFAGTMTTPTGYRYLTGSAIASAGYTAITQQSPTIGTQIINWNLGSNGISECAWSRVGQILTVSSSDGDFNAGDIIVGHTSGKYGVVRTATTSSLHIDSYNGLFQLSEYLINRTTNTTYPGSVISAQEFDSTRDSVTEFQDGGLSGWAIGDGIGIFPPIVPSGGVVTNQTMTGAKLNMGGNWTIGQTVYFYNSSGPTNPGFPFYTFDPDFSTTPNASGKVIEKVGSIHTIAFFNDFKTGTSFFRGDPVGAGIKIQYYNNEYAATGVSDKYDQHPDASTYHPVFSVDEYTNGFFATNSTANINPSIPINAQSPISSVTGTVEAVITSPSSAFVQTSKPPTTTTSLSIIGIQGSFPAGSTIIDQTTVSSQGGVPIVQNYAQIQTFTDTTNYQSSSTTLTVQNVVGTFAPGDAIADVQADQTATVQSVQLSNGQLILQSLNGTPFLENEAIVDTGSGAFATFLSSQNQVITDNTAHATVLYDNGSQLVVNSVTGTFAIGDTIEGTSTYTATISGQYNFSPGDTLTQTGGHTATVLSDNGSQVIVNEVVGAWQPGAFIDSTNSVSASLVSIGNPKMVLLPLSSSTESQSWIIVPEVLKSSSVVTPVKNSSSTFITNITAAESIFKPTDRLAITDVDSVLTVEQLYYPENVVQVDLSAGNGSIQTLQSLFPSSETGTQYVVLVQNMESTSSLWSPVASIVIGTQFITVREEYSGTPVTIGTANLGSNATTGSFQKVLLETPIEVLPQESWRGILSYEPRFEKLSSLGLSKEDLKNLDIQVYWRNRLTNSLTPLSLYNGGSANIRLMFKRIQE